MPSEGFQVGVVKGSQVIYAQGFEIDLARALAKQLGLTPRCSSRTASTAC